MIFNIAKSLAKLQDSQPVNYDVVVKSLTRDNSISRWSRLIYLLLSFCHTIFHLPHQASVLSGYDRLEVMSEKD